MYSMSSHCLEVEESFLGTPVFVTVYLITQNISNLTNSIQSLFQYIPMWMVKVLMYDKFVYCE